MRDELIQPSFAIFNSPGVYALLLGSGISRAAQIPTGYEVILDLISKVAASINEEITSDPIEWYENRFTEKAEYDKLLKKLGNTPADRQAILKKYFEPSDEDLEEGRKVPTKAHNAIAWLIKHRFIRVVVTTNFDRLLEKALSNIGIEAQVVIENSIQHMSPLQHADVTIIKIHGDYLEINLKNTIDELSDYSESLKKLLQRVFSEYGLIICGWSGLTDKALRELLAQDDFKSPYATYFTSYSHPESITKSLIEKRNALQINSIDADILYTEIQQMIDSLSGINQNQKLSTEILIERLKKALSKSNSQIEVDDLVHNTLEQVIGDLAKVENKNRLSILLANKGGEEKFKAIMSYFLEIIEPLVHIAFILGKYSNSVEHASLLTYILERLYSVRYTNFIWDIIPNILITYAVGIASVLNDKWLNIQAILLQPNLQLDLDRAVPDPYKYKSYLGKLMYGFTVGYYYFSGKNLQAVVGNTVFEILSSEIKKHEASIIKLRFGFDLFEMVTALTFLRYQANQNRDWMPLHSNIFYSQSWEKLIHYWDTIGKNFDHIPLVSDFFSNTDENHLFYLVKQYCQIAEVFRSESPRLFERNAFPKFYESLPDQDAFFQGYMSDGID